MSFFFLPFFDVRKVLFFFFAFGSPFLILLLCFRGAWLKIAMVRSVKSWPHNLGPPV